MKLAFDSYRSKTLLDHPNRKRFTVVALHGLLGTRKNWSVVAHKLVNHCDKVSSSSSSLEKRVEVDFFAFDLRNHGDSPHGKEHSLDAMSADIGETLPILLNSATQDKLFPHTPNPYDQPIVLMGHSMGGAAVLYHSWREMCSFYGSDDSAPNIRQRMVSTQCAENNLVVGNVAVDMAPAPRPASFYRMFDIIRLMKKLPIDPSAPGCVQSRSEAERWLTQQVQERLGDPPLDPSLCQYLLTNLATRSEGGQFYWRPNLDTLIDCGPKVLWKVQEPIDKQRVEVPTMFLFGGNSTYKNEQSLAAIPRYFDRPRIETIAGAGHFVHVEKRNQTVEHLYEFMASL